MTIAGFCQAFLLLSTLITAAKLSTDTGGGDYFFTLLGAVVLGGAAPYLVALSVMRQLRSPWAAAVGVATILFGLVDAGVRTQAFFFPTDTSDGGMALWLPIWSVALIPLATVLVHTVLGVYSRGRYESSLSTTDIP